LVEHDRILGLLKTIMDPELDMDVVTAGMIRSLRIEGSSVHITMALTSDKCPMGERMKGEVEDAVKSMEGIGSVDVELSVMTEEERNALLEKLKAKRSKEAPPAPPEKLPKRGIKQIIAVLSGKGGVGKSSVTSMLAVELSRRGFKVGVLDADITGPSIPKMFGVIEAPFVLEGKIIPATSKGGIKIMSMNLLLGGEEDAPVIWRGPLISSAIRQFFTDVDWAELDYLVVDLPPGTSDAQLTVLQLIPVDGIVVVSSPQELASVIVGKAVTMSKRLSVPILGVVENMSYAKCPHCGGLINIFGESHGRLLADNINTKYLGALPLDPALSKACDEGKIEDYKSDAFKSVAAKLLD